MTKNPVNIHLSLSMEFTITMDLFHHYTFPIQLTSTWHLPNRIALKTNTWRSVVTVNCIFLQQEWFHYKLRGFSKEIRKINILCTVPEGTFLWTEWKRLEEKKKKIFFHSITISIIKKYFAEVNNFSMF